MLQFDRIKRAWRGIALIECAVLLGLAMLGVATIIMIAAQSNATNNAANSNGPHEVPVEIVPERK